MSDCNILYKEDVMKLGEGLLTSGYVYIQNYSEQPTRNGSTFIGGTLNIKGDVAFKVWRGTCFDAMKQEDYRGSICSIEAEINVYGGTKSLILKSCKKVPQEVLDSENLKKIDFLETKYDRAVIWGNFETTLKKYLSNKAYGIFDVVICQEVKGRFTEEYAAISHHDNCVSGLLAHTFKVCKLATIVRLYPNILEKVSQDVLFLGCALHDIGKIIEYDNGTISAKGRVASHLVWGVEMLTKHKDFIIEVKGEDFYNQLQSIVATHHGIYGEHPRTFGAYVVHLLDMFESKLASLDQAIENSDGSQLKVEDFTLS